MYVRKSFADILGTSLSISNIFVNQNFLKLWLPSVKLILNHVILHIYRNASKWQI